MQNPTLQNAHNLRSQLGSEIRILQKKDSIGGLDSSGRSDLNNYIGAKSSLDSDMNNYLSSIDPSIAQQYQAANLNWRQNVAPYTARPKIAQMAKGTPENIGNISTAFKNPSPNVQQIISHLPQQTQNQILYSELGKYTPSKSAQNLVNSFNQLDQKGLSSYITPELESSMSALQSKINAAKGLQYAGGFGLGGALGHALGMGPEGISLAGAGMSYAIPKLMNFLPSTQKSPLLGNVARGTYPTARAAFLANYLNNSGVNNGS